MQGLWEGGAPSVEQGPTCSTLQVVMDLFIGTQLSVATRYKICTLFGMYYELVHVCIVLTALSD